MRDPRRAERRWLALAVALRWLVSLGTELDVALPDGTSAVPDLRALLGGTGRMRRIRRCRLGWRWLLARTVMAHPLPLPQRLVPAPWPGIPLPKNNAISVQEQMVTGPMSKPTP